MISTKKHATGFVAALAGLALIFSLGADARKKPAVDLGGPDRYLTFVSTDKPIYRPGEQVYVRATVLHSDKHTPLAQPELATIEITGPKGDVVAGGQVQIQDSVGGFAWPVPATMAGGEYTIKVQHPFTGHVPGVRKFDVRAYRAPRLKSQIVFVRDGYGPGDTVAASVHVDRAEGGVPANARTTIIARVDGIEVFSGKTTIDAAGNASTSFPLPTSIARGEGTLAFVIEDGGVVETASKTIPILLQTLDLTLYPEGGDLVAGVPSRVYLEAFTPAKKPADLAGVIVDDLGQEVATVTTAHEGRGRFDFTPVKDRAYTLKITRPSGIKTTYPLPAAKAQGAALRPLDDVSPKGQPVKVSVVASGAGKYNLTLSKREKVLASSEVAASTQAQEVALAIPADVDGVLIATLWDDKGLPVAERLLFRAPAKNVNLDIKPDQDSYVPAGTVKLTITATDDAGKPLSTMVGMTVTDDSVLEMIEKREQAPRLPVMVLLEADVKELADAHVYLDAANPKAPQAVDLLMGTQGWRRFAFHRAAEFMGKHGDDARRVLAFRMVEAPTTASGMVLLEGAMARPGGMPRPMKGAEIQDQAKNMDAPEDKAQKPIKAEPAGVVVEQPKMDAKDAQAEAAAAMPVVVGGGDRELAQKLRQAQAGQQANRGVVAATAPRFANEELARRNDMVAVREYAHAVRPNRQPDDRIDFAETLFWNAGVKTDPKTGQATIAFALSDAVTSFRVFADGFAGDGAVGSKTAQVKSIQPFYAELKMPLEVTQGDRVNVPLTLVNGTANRIEGATYTIPKIKSLHDWSFANKPWTLLAGARDRKLLEFTVGDAVGSFDFAITATAGAYSDTIARKLKVAPRGFPIEYARGGLIGPNASVSYEIEVPQDLVPGSASSDVAVYPTPLANLTQALEALIQSPSGCFEQTSSTTYPLIMAQQYFMSHQGVDPKLIEKSRTLLDQGYQRLVGFECKKTRGFEWFGADPGHDALSAYGLLEFTDMAIVREVDKTMLANTREFVLGSRDGKGGYKRLTHTLHTWIADPECNNGYITWALLECGTDARTLQAEVAWIRDNIPASKNSYAVALGANVLHQAGDREKAKLLMDKLAAKQADSGMVEGSTTSVIGSGGEALQIETTALATLAWLRDPNYAGNVEKAMKWLCESCKAGRFGSTQSTILALRAIVTYDKLRARPKAPGTVQVLVDGHAMGPVVAFDEKTTGAIKLQDIAEMLSPGKHTIVLKMTGGASMPFSLGVRYNTLKPNSSEQCQVTLRTTLRNNEVVEGGITEAVVTVTNRSDKTIPTPIAIIGIPGGLEVRHDQLKELVKSGAVDAYEVIGRDVVLYWRAMKGGAGVDVPLSLVAAIPGTYSGPASRAYLYYTDEHKCWADPMKVTITPK